MMYQILKQEIKYTFSFPLVYISLLLYVIFFTFLFSRGQVVVGAILEKEWFNSPHAIAANTVFFTLLGMMVALPIFNNAGNREYQNGFQEILFSTPISKSQFFFGRFLGAFCLLLIPGILFFGLNILGVQIGLQTGQILADEIGPFRLMPYLKTFFYIILPNIFIVGGIVFALAVHFKNIGFSILGAIVLNAFYLMALYGFGTDINHFWIGALIDPFGEFAFGVDTRYYTVLERNTMDISLSGHLLKNRLLWLLLSGILLGLTYWKFSFQLSSTKNKKTILSKPTATDIIVNQPFPSVNQTFDKKLYSLQFKSFYQTDLRNIVSQLVYKLFVFGLSAMVLTDFINRHHDYGVADFPVTYRMIENLRDYDVLVLIFLVYFTGELVWNDRKNHIHEVINAAPYSTALAVFSKVLASWLAILGCYISVFIVCISLQVSQGFFKLDLLQYATELSLQIAPFYLFVACLSIFIQMLVNHKFVAYALTIFLFVGQVFLFNYLDIESNMLRLGQNGDFIFSDMNRYGPFLKGNIYFGIYWMITGLVLLIPTVLLWVRSEDRSILKRGKQYRQNWSPGFAKVAFVLCGFWFLLASFVFYNTKILNRYSTRQQTLFSQEQYERLYKKYENAKLTNITNAQFFIDLYPAKRVFKSKTVLTIKNSHNQAIDSLFFSTRNDNRSHGWNCTIHIPNATLVLDDTHTGFQIYKLANPLQAHDSLVIEALANYSTQGFENAVENDGILDNGTFIHHAQVLPHFGYRKENEIRDKKERKDRNLPERVAILPLEMDSCVSCSNNQLSDHHGWLNMETIISTSSDQTAVTSGRLIRQWTDNNRQYFHYKLDHSSLLFNSFISARYEVARRTWQGIHLEVYYDKKHAYNVDYMLDEMEKAMQYYTENFGPYFHQQVRIIEFPRYGNYAQAFPGSMPYSESRGFILDYHPDTDNSPIASTVGHEIAHQWWGHQVVSAEMEGSQFLIESFAEYASLMLMKKNVGEARMMDFLKYDYDHYLFNRIHEREQELPLYKVADQPYIYYRKGSVAMYALAAMIGEEKVNQSLRNFLKAYRYQKAPFPRSIDYLEYLKKEVPDSMQYLVNDLFYDITFFENAIEKASVQKLKNGQYQVNVSLTSHKLKIDRSGKENKVAIQDWFELGFYFKNKEREVLLKKVKLTDNQLNINFILDDQPEKVVLDPRFLFFDRNLGDNEVLVTSKEYRIVEKIN